MVRQGIQTGASETVYLVMDSFGAKGIAYREPAQLPDRIRLITPSPTE
jgi:hypothetical protein